MSGGWGSGSPWTTEARLGGAVEGSEERWVVGEGQGGESQQGAGAQEGVGGVHWAGEGGFVSGRVASCRPQAAGNWPK